MYREALQLRDRFEQALQKELGDSLPDYEAWSKQDSPASGDGSYAPEQGGALPRESTKDTVILTLPAPVLVELRKQWGQKVAVNDRPDGRKEFFLASPDFAPRRLQIAADISQALGRAITIPPGTDRVLIVTDR